VFAGYTWTIPVGDGDIQLGARTRMSASYVITAPAARAVPPAGLHQDRPERNVQRSRRHLVSPGLCPQHRKPLTLSSAQIVANFGGTFDDGTAQLSDPRL
jgi:iron complex outermembrane receptor protein